MCGSLKGVVSSESFCNKDVIQVMRSRLSTFWMDWIEYHQMLQTEPQCMPAVRIVAEKLNRSAQEGWEWITLKSKNHACSYQKKKKKVDSYCSVGFAWFVESCFDLFT